MTGVLIRERRGRFETHTQRGEGHVERKAETGVKDLQAKDAHDCQQQPQKQKGMNRLQRERGPADTLV